MGLWIFESCRKEWEADGITIEYDAILDEVVDTRGFSCFIFPDDERFLNPPSMLAAISTQLAETEQPEPDRASGFAKLIFDSLAFRYASVLRSIESVTGRKLTGIEILGGGGRNRYLNQMTANASGLPARSGLTEATVVGNVLVQAVSSGRFESLAAARSYVETNVEFEEFAPQRLPEIAEAAERYFSIESRFIDLMTRSSDRK